MNKNKAAFFDRDGTLIDDVNYLSSLDQIKVISKALEVCRLLQSKGYMLFVVTNQSGIARGYFDENFVNKTHDHLKSIFQKEGINLKKFYFCPHHPIHALEEKYKQNCECRKPNPGMLLQAAREFDINLSQSLMFGDKELDVQAGNAAGCRSFYIQNVDYAKLQGIK